jgi:hypothetical protein
MLSLVADIDQVNNSTNRAHIPAKPAAISNRIDPPIIW